MTTTSRKYTWWQRGISLALSCAMVVATTPMGALADELAEPEPEPVVYEVVDEVVEDEIDDADATDDEIPAEEVVVPTDEPAAPVTEDEPEAITETEETTDEDVAPVVEEAEPVVSEDPADAADLEAAEPELKAQDSNNQFFYPTLDDTWRSSDVYMRYTDWSANPSTEDVCVDFWEFELTQAGNVTLSVRTGSGDIQWVFYDLYNSSVDILGPTVQGAGKTNTATRWLEPSTYRVMVFSSQNATTGGYYNVKVKYQYDTKRALTSCTFNGKASGSISSLSKKTYTGAAITPAVTVKYQGTTLAKNVDYTVAYKANKKVGTAKITITGKGQYTGSKVIKFKIVKRSIKKVKVSIPTKKWTGKAIKPNPTVKIGKTKLKKGTDYKIVKYENNKNAGTAKVTIKGKGGLTGTRTIKFKIRYDITKSNSVTGYYRPGTTTFTKFVYRKTGKTMKNKTDYKLSVYKNDSTEKVYKMVGKGKYMGTTYFTFYK